MTRSRLFLAGLAFTYGYQALVLVTGLWLTPFFLRNVGQHDYGLWLLGTQLLTYLGLTDLGVVALLPQETAYATGRAGGFENAPDLPEIIGRTIRLVLYQLPIVAAVAIALWFTIPAEWHELKGPLLVVLAGYVAMFPLRLVPALLQGLQDLSFTGRMQVLNWAISTGATVSMVAAGWSLYALAIGWLVSQAVLMPVFYYRLRTRFGCILPNRLPALAWAATREQLTRGSWVSVAQVAQVLMSNTDLLIIGKLLGPSAVVPYACTGKLAGVLANQAQILMQTATPGLCELTTAESRKRLFQAIVALNHAILTLSGLIFCIVLPINRWFVGWWVTSGQYGGGLLTAAILANLLFVHWDTVAAYSVFCLGRQRRIALTNLGNGFATAGGALVLTAILGPVGAPLGSMIGTCLVGLPFNLTIIARDTGVTLPRLISTMIGSFTVRFALPAAGALLLATRWSPHTFPEALAIIAITVILYSLIMLPGVMRTPLGDYVRPLLASLRVRYPSLSKALSYR
jgi:O-antigen/teichoic acid export membrane protein